MTTRSARVIRAVDSLDDYVSRQLGNTDLLQAATDSDQRFGKQLAGGLDQ